MAGRFLAFLIVTYTYICFFHNSKRPRRTFFNIMEMLPYRYPISLPSIPRLRQTAYTRLLSTPQYSTSELLRTL